MDTQRATGASTVPAHAGEKYPLAASAGAFVLGFAAPLVVALGSRWLMDHAEKVARDAASLLVLLVFACFTVLALRMLPGRRWRAVGLLYGGATLGTAMEVLLDPVPGRLVMVEILVVWWLAAPAVFAGILLEQVWRGRRGAR